jgi:hypothetical protein
MMIQLSLQSIEERPTRRCVLSLGCTYLFCGGRNSSVPTVNRNPKLTINDVMLVSKTRKVKTKMYQDTYSHVNVGTRVQLGCKIVKCRWSHNLPPLKILCLLSSAMAGEGSRHSKHTKLQQEVQRRSKQQVSRQF